MSHQHVELPSVPRSMRVRYQSVRTFDPTPHIGQATHINPMQSRYPIFHKWTPEDHERLKVMAADGRWPREIAAALKRTEASVRARAWQHGIALRVKTLKKATRKR